MVLVEYPRPAREAVLMVAEHRLILSWFYNQSCHPKRICFVPYFVHALNFLNSHEAGY